MVENHEVSHGDIYRALGNLEGKVDSVVLQLGQKRDDLTEAFRRLTELEKKVAGGVVLCLVLSMVIPMAMTAASPKLHFGTHPADSRGR